MVSMLDAALGYARADIPVFPCGSNKRPLTSNGFKDASKDPEQIAKWWRKWPRAMIAMPTGKASGISVMDLDKKNGKNGFKSLPDWKTRSQLIVSTMHSGAHLWFEDHKGNIPSTGNKIGDGIDTRGNGGYVIVPPSKGYQWVKGHDLSKLEKWPEDLLPSDHKRKRIRVKNTEPADPVRVSRALAIIPSDDYDDWYKAAAALRNEFGDDKGFDLFKEWSKKSDKYSPDKCEKKWDEVEGITTINIGTIFHWANKIDPNWDDDEEPEIPDEAKIEEFIAYMPAHNYTWLPNRMSWPSASVNAKLGKVRLENGKKITASAWLDKNRAVEMQTWSPGDPLLIKDRLVIEGGWIEKPGVMLFNQYIGPDIKPGNGSKAKPWIDLLCKIYPNDYKHILNFFAQRVQTPQTKINHCLLLGGATGIGKDTILEALRRAVGPWNYAEATPQQLTSRFNAYIKSVVLRVSEARDMGELNRYAFYEHTKTLMAAPPDTLPCEEKHVKAYMVFNVTAVIMTSNHKTTGIYLPEDDCRHYVAWSPITKDDFNDNFWKKFWYWYEYEHGFEHVAAFLREWDISGFDPKAAPPKTEAFLDIVDASRAPEDLDLSNALSNIKRKGIDIPNPEVTNKDEIIEAANSVFTKWLEDPSHARAFHHRMEACGYAPIRNPRRTKNGLWGPMKNQYALYARKNFTIKEQLAAAMKFEYNQEFK